MIKKIILVCCLLSILFVGWWYRMNNNNSLIEDFVINSKEYWDFRFKTQDWQNNQGNEQTLHFYTLLLNAIPEALQDEINIAKYTILDFGCAQGEGTDYFAKMLPNTIVTGVDFSQEAVEIARKKHPNKVTFICEDFTKLSTPQPNFDVIISSNTLEHFYNPWDVLYKLTTHARKYVIILVPFNQQGIPTAEHFYSFNYDNIPGIINNFKLSFKKILYPDPKYWGEKQILLIYSYHP